MPFTAVFSCSGRTALLLCDSTRLNQAFKPDEYTYLVNVRSVDGGVDHEVVQVLGQVDPDTITMGVHTRWSPVGRNSM